MAGPVLVPKPGPAPSGTPFPPPLWAGSSASRARPGPARPGPARPQGHSCDDGTSMALREQSGLGDQACPEARPGPDRHGTARPERTGPARPVPGSFCPITRPDLMGQGPVRVRTARYDMARPGPALRSLFPITGPTTCWCTRSRSDAAGTLTPRAATAAARGQGGCGCGVRAVPGAAAPQALWRGANPPHHAAYARPGPRRDRPTAPRIAPSEASSAARPPAQPRPRTGPSWVWALMGRALPAGTASQIRVGFNSESSASCTLCGCRFRGRPGGCLQATPLRH